MPDEVVPPAPTAAASDPFESARERVRARVQKLPDQPGIYVFQDAQGKALYVGKAKSLRKRAANYLAGDLDSRLMAMMAEAAELEFVVTDSEAEALLLENNWIKRKQPRYNLRLRDDKTYPYLKLTLHEAYPRLVFTRRIRNDGAEYFGPYLPAGLARRAIKLVQKLCGVRVCSIEIDGSLPRPCLYFDMKRCLGPCVAALTTDAAYGAAVEQARLFLSGRNDQLLRRLRQEMLEASEALEFERAARLRDAIGEVTTLSERRKLSSEDREDVDIYGVYVAGGNASLTALIMRDGQVLDRRELFWEGEAQVSPERLLSEVLPQIYERTTFIPKEIDLPFPIEGAEALADWLSERKGERVYLRLPVRGARAERVALAQRNAELAYRRRFRREGPSAAAVDALQRHLGLSDPPRRIEGLDISNLQGTEIVASLVVWEDGRMRKGEYRSFNVRGLPGQDDFAAMRQAVERRYRRRLEETGEMPDLILIDGGRGQLNAALEALARWGWRRRRSSALAKREEEIYLPALPEPLRLDRADLGLRLLQEIRDEAHRFALRRHRGRRSARTLRSGLDDLAGIGPTRRKLLLDRFGSAARVRTASREELQDALGGRVGAAVFSQLQEKGATENAAGPG